ncbi:helix-turn-helix transcriptional regulator [Bacillus horti]|uniref:DNA-binding transcriptional regulator YafY n=1 Tax=Caldalkalibacillus horti TaxID=77523 RepID=A0ABT9VTW4_9BACI|nr:YafY family protein [Bacillus horti]MDQ0164330.1 putative DNA-binding transcriptional regulator YafY [Bacillus horti]
MKLERLLSIVVLLLNRKKVQAKELADLFEVSVRTIYRDIESINQAGIPIVTLQGANGGIGLVEGYKLDRNILTNNELTAIFTALQSLSTTHANTTHQLLLEKLSSIVPTNDAERFLEQTKQFIIDLSSWSDNPELENKIEQLKKSIERQWVVTFLYCSPQGDRTHRSVEPYTLVLKRHSWYLYAFCQNRERFRLFKLQRMKNIDLTNEAFVRESISLADIPWQKEWNKPANQQKVVLRFHPKTHQLAEEWFGVEKLNKDKQGYYVVESLFPEDNWLYGFILSFGAGVEVLEPTHLRQKIKDIAKQVGNQYAESKQYN